MSDGDELASVRKLLQEKTAEVISLQNKLFHVSANCDELTVEIAALKAPIPMLLDCLKCHVSHVDEGEFATKPHRTHRCKFCGAEWRPALVATVGVAKLPA